MKPAIVVFGLAAVLLTGRAAAQSAGLAPEWEVRKDLAVLVEHANQFKPILERATPDKWPGAGSVYIEQGKQVSAQLDYLIITINSLSKEPEKVSLALSAVFRMQSLEPMLRSYAEGIRRYQNPALAELLLAAMPALAVDRDKLRQYTMDLAVDREQAFKLADAEAQKCRAGVPRQPRK